MKRKIAMLLLATGLTMSVVGCGDTAESESNEPKTEASKPSETKKEDKPITGKVDKVSVDCAEGTLTYKKHEVINDEYDGSPLLLVYFDYTNKKEETSYSQMTFNAQVFQNGVECDTYFNDLENEALTNSTKEIQKDTTLEIAYMFKLQDNTNPVTLKVTDQSVENLMNNYSQEQELALQ